MTRSGKRSTQLCYLLLVFACLLTVPQPVLAVSGEAEIAVDTRAYTYTTAVHSSSAFSSTVIGRMENGTTVTVLGQTGDFYKIDCCGMTGYVAKYQLAVKPNGIFYISCYKGSSDTQILYYDSLADALSLRHSILDLGNSYMGVPYVYGGMSPRGFDCSGFVKYLYDRHDIELTRTASRQLSDGIVVSKEALQVGDLIFLRYAGETAPASHVGIYAGNGKILHASSSRGIALNDLDSDYYSRNYLCARRIINTAATQIETVSAASALWGVPRTAGLRTLTD